MHESSSIEFPSLPQKKSVSLPPLQARRLVNEEIHPEEANSSLSGQLLSKAHKDQQPAFSNSEVPIMKVTKHKNTVSLVEAKDDGKKDKKGREAAHPNVLARGTLLGSNNVEADLTGFL